MILRMGEGQPPLFDVNAVRVYRTLNRSRVRRELVRLWLRSSIMPASQPSRLAPVSSHSEFSFEPLLDSDEAADLLRIHPKTLQKMVRNQQLHGIEVGKLWRFRASDLELWLKTKRAG